jgi:hypothetical protein
MSAFKSLIQLITDGQDVSAATINRILRDLQGNTVYIKDVLEASLLGTAVFAREQTVETDASVGMAVYYNAETQQFERALAEASVDSTTGVLAISEKAKPWGVVYYKHNSTLADIILTGSGSVDISNAIDGDVEAGTYYLSSTTPGFLVKTEPPVTIPVLQADGEGLVFVKTNYHDSLEGHKHFAYNLKCVPAGDHETPSPGDPHEITNADDEIEGWLPADHASFDGNAPDGAAFGYNLSASPLRGVWPPFPLQSVHLEWNKALDDSGATGVPLGADGLCIIDNNGIWWMSDCYQDVPWPYSLDTPGESSDVSDPSDVECPRHVNMELKLWFTKMTFQTAGTVVTSLRAVEGSGLIVRCVDGDDASAGDLEIDLDMDLVDGVDDEAGYLAFKSRGGNTFNRGPIVEKIVAGSNVTITQTGPTGQGVVTINAELDLDGKDIGATITRLNNVTEEPYKGTLGLGLANGRTGSFTSQIDVPAALPSGQQLSFTMRILARSAGALPTLTVEKLIIPAASTVTSLPTTWSSVTFAPSVTFSAADQYIDTTSSPFNVTAGDIVLIKVTRASGSSGPDLHVLRQRGKLTPA